MACASEAREDVLVIEQEVLAMERSGLHGEPHGIGELVVDVGFGGACPPAIVHDGEMVAHPDGGIPVGEADRAIDDDEAREDAGDELGGEDTAGEAIAEEVIDAIGTEGGEGSFEKPVDGIVLELIGAIAEGGESASEIGTMEEFGLDLFVVILFLGFVDEIDGVREGGVGDVVEESCDLFELGGAEGAQEDEDADGMFEPGNDLEGVCESGGSRLADAAKALECGGTNQIQQGRFGEFDIAIDTVVEMHPRLKG